LAHQGKWQIPAERQAAVRGAPLGPECGQAGVHFVRGEAGALIEEGLALQRLAQGARAAVQRGQVSGHEQHGEGGQGQQRRERADAGPRQ
jgi:hypothetical protein